MGELKIADEMDYSILSATIMQIFTTFNYEETP